MRAFLIEISDKNETILMKLNSEVEPLHKRSREHPFRPATP